MNRLKRWLILSVLLCVGVAHAADPLLISGGSDRAIPIAVVPFGWQGASALPEDIADIIGKDLRNSGTFQPIARQNMISQPAQTSEVIYRDWS
ncbi:MAG TPA: Tol-Pal system protein TolB, partial [Gammaproteobacteria bacterium]|nr:Tol-Pal system protein TolB [Gammaproteobacteria bacterium]